MFTIRLSKNGSPLCFLILCNYIHVHNEISGAISHSVLQAVSTFLRTWLSHLSCTRPRTLCPYCSADHTPSLPWMTGRWLLLHFVIWSLDTQYSVRGSITLPSEKLPVKFNVFHVHELYYTKTLITNKCTKRVLSSIVTHSYMFRPCWVILRENFFVTVTLRLHFIVEWECAVDCVLRCFRRFGLQARTTESSRLQYTIHSQQHILTQL
jgi:hypothetical protein